LALKHNKLSPGAPSAVSPTYSHDPWDTSYNDMSFPNFQQFIVVSTLVPAFAAKFSFRKLHYMDYEFHYEHYAKDTSQRVEEERFFVRLYAYLCRNPELYSETVQRNVC
jgi:hypothetical protein